MDTKTSSFTQTVQGTSGGGGTVTSVSGTTNQINSSGGNTPVLSLSSTISLPGTINKVTINAPTTAATLAFGTDNATITFQGTDTYVGRATTDTLSNKTFVAPALGAATATSINKVTITAPATGSTLTIADGKTLTVSNSLTLAGTDATVMTFPATSDTVVTLGATQTLTAKTLTAPVISTITNTGTLTLPTTTGNIVGAAATLTNHALVLGVGTTQVQTTNNIASAAGTIFSTYNGIATVGNGMPSEVGTVASSQSALISATTLYSPTATGRFRISCSLVVTTAATTSSILGGTTGVVITYTDGTSSVAQSVTMGANNQAGASITIGSGNTGNATTTQYLCVPIYIFAKTGVAIQYAVGYTSVGGTAMVYEAYLMCESL